MQKLILWDIDGTLLYSGGISGENMRAAMGKIFGAVVKRERTFYSGKTDWQIIAESFPDLSPGALVEALPTFRTAYVAQMHERREDMLLRSKVMPGVKEVLAALHEQVAQAPLTGNIAPIAQLKLDWLGLLPYMNMDVGAYGDDHQERPCLVPIARERASHCYGHAFVGNALVIVGDTPFDIDCGKLNGARTVAVATGPYSLDELRAHQPDALLSDLSDTDAARAAILG